LKNIQNISSKEKEIQLNDIKKGRYYFMDIKLKKGIYEAQQFMFIANIDFEDRHTVEGSDIYNSIEEYMGENWVIEEDELKYIDYKLYEVKPDDYPEFFI
jgi:uncharacterized protein YktB (UPF0637 family)